MQGIGENRAWDDAGSWRVQGVRENRMGEGIGENRAWESAGCGKVQGVEENRMWKDAGCWRVQGVGENRTWEDAGCLREQRCGRVLCGMSDLIFLPPNKSTLALLDLVFPVGTVDAGRVCRWVAILMSFASPLSLS